MSLMKGRLFTSLCCVRRNNKGGVRVVMNLWRVPRHMQPNLPCLSTTASLCSSVASIPSRSNQRACLDAQLQKLPTVSRPCLWAEYSLRIRTCFQRSRRLHLPRRRLQTSRLHTGPQSVFNEKGKGQSPTEKTHTHKTSELCDGRAVTGT